jgi:Txe/YoeB family toxin of toxin-antitoxin system
MYRLEFHKKTIADKQNLSASGLLQKTEKLCKALPHDPKPLYSKQLSGDLKGKRSIRINLQHRLVYEIVEEEKIIKILSMWTHYE